LHAIATNDPFDVYYSLQSQIYVTG
jgi:hypothetical protein